jgi:hypothetical protein
LLSPHFQETCAHTIGFDDLFRMADFGSVNASAEARHTSTGTGFQRDSSPDTNTRGENGANYPCRPVGNGPPAGRLQVCIFAGV